MLINNLTNQGAITPPKWLPDSVQFLSLMGSNAYGVSDDYSDRDVYGFCIPPKEIVFPHTAGVIFGFGHQGERFDQWQEHHVVAPDSPGVTYDFAVFSIVKYFQLCMDNNPNMLNSLFVPDRCILQSTKIASMVRATRRTFLHKGAFHKFKGYAYSQISKIKNKTGAQDERRAASIAHHGYDLKYAYHTVRLLGEVEQILAECDLDIERNAEMLRAIRRGEWTFEDVEAHFKTKEAELDRLHAVSKLPEGPCERVIRTLLMACLEEHYGRI